MAENNTDNTDKIQEKIQESLATIRSSYGEIDTIIKSKSKPVSISHKKIRKTKINKRSSIKIDSENKILELMRNSDSKPKAELRETSDPTSTSLHSEEDDRGITLKGVPIAPIIYNRPINHLRTVERRGNTYTIRDSLPSDDDSSDTGNGINKMINDLYKESMHMSISASRKAGLFKFVNIIISLAIIICGAIVGIETFNICTSDTARFLVSTMGFLITAMQTISTTFSFEKRGVLLRDVSNKLRKISRDVKTLESINMPIRNKMRKLDKLYAEVDQLDISIFDMRIVSSPNIGSNNIRFNNSDDIPLNDSTEGELYTSRKLFGRKDSDNPDNQSNQTKKIETV